MPTVYGIAAAVLLLDQFSKYLAVRFLESGLTVPVIPHAFHLSLVYNTGIAFGLFQGYPAFWIFAITASLIVLTAGAWFFRAQAWGRRFAYGLVLGGAYGNWIDRIRVHSVIDFFDFRVWPVFNVADACITVGIGILIWISIKTPKDP